MNIGKASVRSGLPSKTIRYYEEIDLVRPARGANGYRDFSERDAQVLAFLARARSLGFSIEDCRTLISLYQDRDRASADVKRLAEEHVARITEKIAELEAMRGTLRDLAARCRGDDQPDCPILDDLCAGPEARRRARTKPAKSRSSHR
jgi:Cu(I)-responsive transcriptional regulator